jgi:hypothetical protein
MRSSIGMSSTRSPHIPEQAFFAAPAPGSSAGLGRGAGGYQTQIYQQQQQQPEPMGQVDTFSQPQPQPQPQPQVQPQQASTQFAVQVHREGSDGAVVPGRGRDSTPTAQWQQLQFPDGMRSGGAQGVGSGSPVPWQQQEVPDGTRSGAQGEVVSDAVAHTAVPEGYFGGYQHQGATELPIERGDGELRELRG